MVCRPRGPLLVVAWLAVATACRAGGAGGPAAGIVEQRREGIMGTRVSVKVWSPGGRDWDAKVAGGIEAAFAEALEVQSRMSPVDPGSAVSRINAAAGARGVVVDPWTWQVLEESISVSELTGGAFDPTWAALDDLWDFRAASPVPPSREEVADRLGLVGVKGILMDPAHRTVKLGSAGMRIGLGGSAKGFALDRMASALIERGIENFICYAGGDLYVSGRPGDRPWRLGIQHPRKADELLARYEASRAMAVVTSGDYERFFIHGGRRYHHILDPRTGFPAGGALSVTVMAGSGLRADALSTGLFVLGADAGLALVERLAGVEAVFVDDAGRVRSSSGIRDGIEVLSGQASIFEK